MASFLATHAVRTQCYIHHMASDMTSSHCDLVQKHNDNMSMMCLWLIEQILIRFKLAFFLLSNLAAERSL